MNTQGLSAGKNGYPSGGPSPFFPAATRAVYSPDAIKLIPSAFLRVTDSENLQIETIWRFSRLKLATAE
jgi:hypothetical protein